MKSIVLIGSGNLAEALAEALSRSEGIELRQLFGRNEARIAELSARNGIPGCTDPSLLAPADLYLLAVSDAAIAPLATTLPFAEGAAVVHTAGGIGIDALPEGIARRGVLYPLQTFTRGRRVDFARIPLFVEGSDEEFARELERLAGRLSRTVARADSARRARLHLAAVFACNFVNHLYALGAEVLRRTDLPFETLAPLIEETAAKAIASGDPARMQTGPAVRGDRPTQRRHRMLLTGDPQLERIYEILSEHIWQTSKKTS